MRPLDAAQTSEPVGTGWHAYDFSVKIAPAGSNGDYGSVALMIDGTNRANATLRVPMANAALLETFFGVAISNAGFAGSLDLDDVTISFE